jgi:CRP-like cAMP-binding protein
MANAFQMSEEKKHSDLPRALALYACQYGDELVKEGEKSPCFFVILSGQVKISKRGKFIRLLEYQDVFGLESILFKRTIPYTAKVMTTSRIASYGPEALDHFFRENPRMTQSILASSLRQLVQTTDSVVQEEGAIRLEEVCVDFFSDGDKVVEEGTPGKDFFRLVSTQGGLKVTKAGKEVSRIEAPGEFFGEMACLLNLPRQATVTSIGESVVERYSSDDLEVIIRDYPEIALQILRTLVSRLAELSRKYTEVSW